MCSTPARTRGRAASPESRRIGVSAADAEDAATSPITAVSIKGRRKVLHLSRFAVKVARVFEGKNALILGVANKRSIAWAIAKRLADGGAKLAFTFQGERIEKNVRDLADSVASPLVTELDVRDDAAIERVFAEVSEVFGGKLDILVHSVAFAAAEDLEGRFTDTPRDRFWMAVDISAYSLVAAARYLAGDLGQKNIRINAVSAGPVRTLAARSIAGFSTMESIIEERAPLRRHIDANDVGAAAAYLLSDAAKNVTGTTLYVDSGYHAMGM